MGNILKCCTDMHTPPNDPPEFAIPLPLSRNESALPAQLPQSTMNRIAYRLWDFWVKKSWMLWVLALVVLLLDQSSKSLIIAWLDWGESWPAEGFLRFTHARNTGTAFSLFQGHSNILSFVAIFAVGVLLWVYWSTGSKSFILRLALGLQLGGALGNLLDRLQQGYVTDFIDVGPWPIFNVADSGISVGMALMIWYFFMNRDQDEAPSTVASTATASLDASGKCHQCSDAMRYGTLHRADSDVPDTQI